MVPINIYIIKKGCDTVKTYKIIVMDRKKREREREGGVANL